MSARKSTTDTLRSDLHAALAAAGIRQLDAAIAAIQALTESARDPGVVLKCCRAFAAGLSNVPQPDLGWMQFVRLLESCRDPVAWTRSLHADPRALEILMRLFVCSEHLTNILVREPELLQSLTAQHRLAEVKTRDDFLAEARVAVVTGAETTGKFDALRRFQRRELLRIGAADSFCLLDLRHTTSQLSKLAEVLIDVCLEVTAEQLGEDPETLGVLALGKLGGCELNYSSDIDLVLLSRNPVEQTVQLAQRMVKGLDDQTAEGFLYRVDLRLRPWGSAGPLVSTPEAFLRYLQTQASEWEKQALLKGRAVAGDVAVVQEFLAAAQPLIFHAEDVSRWRACIQQTRSRIAKERGATWGDVKSGSGSIRDVEFVVQFLQLLHGTAKPAVRTPNTLEALVRLADEDLIDAQEYRQLTEGYVFLRTIEHALQLLHNQQRHTLPQDPHELNYLAQRLDYPDAETFLRYYERHQAAIRSIYRRRLERETVPVSAPYVLPIARADLTVPGYAAVFDQFQQERHRRWLAETVPARPVRVVAERAGSDWEITVVGEDRPGDLSMTCGLLFVHGFDILRGFVSTCMQPNDADSAMFVNTFTVRSETGGWSKDAWQRFEQELNELFVLARQGEPGAAQGALAKRVASVFADVPGISGKLTPVSIEFENSEPENGTLVRIRAEDSPGFLYELTNALALCDLDIKGMRIRTEGTVAEDTLRMTDARHGGAITEPNRLRKLQAAIVLIKQFTHLLPQAPNPEAALLHFRQLLTQLFQQPDWLRELTSLDRPEVLSALARVLGVSDFLWEDLLRLQHANLFPLLEDLSGLDHARSRKELQDQLDREWNGVLDRPERNRRLNAFKDREMFRIDMRHILGKISEFRQFAEELSDLAEVVVESTATMCYAELSGRYGEPRTDGGRISRFVIAALGKFGGRELGFASDIELLVVYEADGSTAGPETLTNADFFTRLVEQLSASIQSRQEGIFEIDLRLRPFGRQGALATSFAAFSDYFRLDGAAWPYERQALVKLRTVAGDRGFGRIVEEARDQILYTGQAFDDVALRAIRERQVRQLVTAGTFHAKHSPGALVDIEYLVQSLQLRHGQESPLLRTPATAAAAQALCDLGYLSDEDHAALQAAYWFYRRLIDALRMVRGNALDLTVPQATAEEFVFLARRLGYGRDSLRLQSEMEFHNQSVLGLCRRYGGDASTG